MTKKSNTDIGRENVFHRSKDIKGISIKGYDFNKGVNYKELVKSFNSTGFQASHLSKSIEIINDMISENAFIFLGYTSNMVSSGLREVFRYLVEHKKINVIVTTAGGIEEDIIKCLGDFILGDFRANGEQLRKNGINRIGNIFVPNSRYVMFEKFMQPILEELYDEQKKGKIITSSDIIWKLGEKINNKESIYYWAWKNKIPVYCPAITDGALGDNIYFFKYKKNLVIDIAEDIKKFNDLIFTLKGRKSGVIILGSGVVKHSILNANMLRNGADYAVYVNTSQEFDGSDSGALPEEAISWGKILPKAKSIKLFGDATILFPLIVAETFANRKV